jgi:hypothetical protein
MKNPFPTLLVSTLFCSIVHAGLKVGVGKTVITPPQLQMGKTTPKVWLAGFGCGRAATGVHDDLEARAIVLDDGKKRVGIVALDLLGLFYDDVERLREQAEASGIPLDLLIVACTHNHNGPDTLGIWGKNHFSRGVRASYMDFLGSQTLAALKEASRTLSPVHARIAQGAAPELVYDFRPPEVKDDVFDVIQFTDTKTGRTVATLVDWGNHPETMGDQNTLLTSDFPHAVREHLEKALGGTAFYLSSSVGGMMSTLGIHLTDSKGAKIPDRSFEKVDRIGELLAGKIVRSLKTAESLEGASFTIQRKTLYVPLANPLFRLVSWLNIIQRKTYTGGELARRGVGEDVKTEVDLVDFGPVQIATIPGELFPELEKGLPENFNPDQSPEHSARYEVPLWVDRLLRAKYKITLGLANDEIGYIIPECDYVPAGILGSHGPGHYEESMSLGKETASRVLNALRGLTRAN